MPSLTRRSFVSALATAAAIPRADAQSANDYPGARTIKVIVPFAPGGTTDLTGRLMADGLATRWGTTVIVENVPGGGTNLGIDRLAKAPADGTTLAVITPGVAINQFLYPKMPYDPEKDIQPLSLTVRIPNLLVVRKDLPVNSVSEFIAYLKANPGKLNFASSGIGSSIHLSGEVFKRATSTDMTHVAYRGSGPALNDLMSGQVDLMFGDIPTVIQLVRSGNLKALGVTTGERYALAPEFPAIGETVAGFDVVSFFGIGVRAGTPYAIAKKIEADAMAVGRDAGVKQKLAAVTAEAVGSSAAEFSSLIERERAKWRTIIADLKIKLE